MLSRPRFHSDYCNFSNQFAYASDFTVNFSRWERRSCFQPPNCFRGHNSRAHAASELPHGNLRAAAAHTPKNSFHEEKLWKKTQLLWNYSLAGQWKFLIADQTLYNIYISTNWVAFTARGCALAHTCTSALWKRKYHYTNETASQAHFYWFSLAVWFIFVPLEIPPSEEEAASSQLEDDFVMRAGLIFTPLNNRRHRAQPRAIVCHDLAQISRRDFLISAMEPASRYTSNHSHRYASFQPEIEVCARDPHKIDSAVLTLHFFNVKIFLAKPCRYLPRIFYACIVVWCLI